MMENTVGLNFFKPGHIHSNDANTKTTGYQSDVWGLDPLENQPFGGKPNTLRLPVQNVYLAHPTDYDQICSPPQHRRLFVAVLRFIPVTLM